MNKEQAIKEIANSSFSDILKRFTFKTEYLSRLERVNAIDLEPVFIMISKPFTILLFAIWCIIITITFPFMYLPNQYLCWKKAKRMAKEYEKNATK